jgi:hypothetical protein
MDQIHGEKEATLAIREQLVQRDQARVRDVGQRAELPLEAVDRVRLEAVQHLERDQRARAAIESFVDGAHRAAADRAPQLEALGKQLARVR